MPLNGHEVLVFPWFIKNRGQPSDFTRHEMTLQIPDMHVEFQLCYIFFRRLPPALFERLSVLLHRILPDKSSRKDWADVVYAKIGVVQILIERDLDSSKGNPELHIKLRSHSSEIVNLWKATQEIYTNVLHDLIEKSPAVITYNNYFICPHCILTGHSGDRNSEPMKHPLEGVMKLFCGQHTLAHCTNAKLGGHETSLIPAAFVYPLLTGKHNER